MLNRGQKEQIVQDLRTDIDRASALFLTNLIGIPSNDSVQIRKNVRDANGKVVVTRNTLFKLAAKGTYAEDLFKDLKGPSAVAFAFSEAPAVAKAIYEASKDFEVVTLAGGSLAGKELNSAQLVELAKLPSREEMLGTLLATFNAPVSAFARVMHQIKEKKESGQPLEAAAPAGEAE